MKLSQWSVVGKSLDTFGYLNRPMFQLSFFNYSTITLLSS
jgi:hypothetical protein